MIRVLASIAGGIAGAVRLALGGVIGAGVVYSWATLIAIPSAAREADRAARAEVRAESAEKVMEAVRDARQVERWILNESDEELRRILGGK